MIRSALSRLVRKRAGVCIGGASPDSEFIVKNHIRRILRQVDAQTRYEAVDVMRASGYLPSA